jgi:diguanylate cyclase (GGDEF)-like protein/PAS domain S-box-containing protein
LAFLNAQSDALLNGEIDETRIEARGMRKDGTILLGVLEARTQKNTDGTIRLLVVTVQDITARREAEQRTRQAATVFESTRDAVLISDLDGNILAINKAFTEITGYNEAEVLGKNPRILNSGRQSPEFYQALWFSLKTAGQWQGEIWERRKTGEIYPAWMTISTVYDGDSKPTHYVAVSTDLSQIKHSEEQLAHIAHYDALTDLPNRSLLQSLLAKAVERTHRRGQKTAVLFVGLDHFATVNETLGHLAGDQLLREVATRLKGRLRDEDTIGRFGSDEFLMILEEINESESVIGIAKSILDLLSISFALEDSQEIYLGTSIGISLYPDDGSTTTDLLRNGEAALHQAKLQGRGRFCFYTEDMNLRAKAQLETEAELHHALERNEFVLYFQPKANLQTGLVFGAEALIRWQPEGQEIRLPSTFIPIAERSALIESIGAWVIDAACAQLKQWRDSGLRTLNLAVNVSGRQFLAGNLPQIVADAIARYGINSANLELELTESILMDDPEQTIATLEALKHLGVKLSLDDFGTGYSSFAYLSRFPMDTLKIDQSFVRDIVTNSRSALIAVSIIELAHRMQLKVIAEGIETEGQLGYLRQRNCDEMQGYYLAQPMNAAKFEEFVREDHRLYLNGFSPVQSNRTLLIVDDETNILAALRRLLRHDGYRILTAENGHQALELLAQNEVQVVISDQRMPEMTGTDFLSHIKTMYPHSVRLVLSGYTDLESVTRAVNAGAIYKFITKPWEDEQLREQIREAFLYAENVASRKER